MLPINHRKVVKRALFAINNCTTLIPDTYPAELLIRPMAVRTAIALADVIAKSGNDEDDGRTEKQAGQPN